MFSYMHMLILVCYFDHNLIDIFPNTEITIWTYAKKHTLQNIKSHTEEQEATATIQNGWCAQTAMMSKRVLVIKNKSYPWLL